YPVYLPFRRRHYVRGSRMRSLFLAVILLLSPCLRAATLQEFVSPFAVRIDASPTEPDWSIAKDMTGIKWKDSVPRTDFRYRNRFVRRGNGHLHMHGPFTVELGGSKDAISEIEVSISQEDGEIVERDQLTFALRSQFDAKTRIQLLTKCDIGGIAGFAMYTVVLDKSGGSAPNSRYLTFLFSHKYQSQWKCDP
ncbi:MAG: hypothetical protein NT042_09895, partial [Sulfuritalea sp.]|nr:hypothetical protein [Sulfuritalea sp.]